MPRRELFDRLELERMQSPGDWGRGIHLAVTWLNDW